MNFNRVAPIYDQLAHVVFGRTLEQAQLSLLDRLPSGGRWLLLGGGTGWLLEQVLSRCQPTSIVYLEASERMLKLAQKRLVNHAYSTKIDYRPGTEAELTEADRFDVILTPFVLDLFPEDWLTNQMIPSLFNALQPGGYWLVTDFVPTRDLVAAHFGDKHVTIFSTNCPLTQPALTRLDVLVEKPDGFGSATGGFPRNDSVRAV